MLNEAPTEHEYDVVATADERTVVVTRETSAQPFRIMAMCDVEEDAFVILDALRLYEDTTQDQLLFEHLEAVRDAADRPKA